MQHQPTPSANMVQEVAVISGANGFIGTHLAQKLVLQGLKVIAIPREMLLYPEILSKFLKKCNPNYIYHLAAYGNHYFQTEEIVAYYANVQCLINLIEASRNIPYKAFLNFSTTHHNLEAGSFYGSTKAAGEYIVRAYVRKYNYPIINIRPYSIYGEYEWSFRFIPTICRQIKAGKPIMVSDVSHDWTYVGDFLDGLLCAATNSSILKGKSVGIGTGTRISNIEVAKTLMDTVHKKVDMLEGIKRSYEIAAYNEELVNKTEDQRNEIEYFNFARTSMKEALRHIYENQHLALIRKDLPKNEKQ